MRMSAPTDSHDSPRGTGSLSTLGEESTAVDATARTAAPTGGRAGRGTSLADPIMLSSDGDVLPTEFRLFARGKNKTKKGTFLFDDEAARLVMAAASAWAIDYSLDYNHAAMNASLPGHERIAAGWFKLEVRNGELWAVDVSWTPRAAVALSNKEFRYISPTFRHEGGRVVEMVNVALTNIPATLGIRPLVAASLGEAMNDELVELGIVSADATPEQVTRAIVGLARMRSDLMSLTDTRSSADAIAAVKVALRDAADAAALREESKKLQRERNAARIDQACLDGLIAPSDVEFATQLSLESPASFERYMASRTPVVKTGEQGAHKHESRDTKKPVVELHLSIAKQLGRSRAQAEKAVEEWESLDGALD